MNISWESAFCEAKTSGDVFYKDNTSLALSDMQELRSYLDLVHIQYGLLKPYFETKKYPVVESRELLPSFESDMTEYSNLPGFCMVAFDRKLHSFQEIFQFDALQNTNYSEDNKNEASAVATHRNNVLTMQNRLPRHLHEEFRPISRYNVTHLENYSRLLPFLLEMDRGQVFAHNENGHFQLAGIYASFPSDLNTEIKNFGLKIRKFEPRNNALYEQNRLFVYQFLMELYGFPIASERRTSSALFARRLKKKNEPFMVRVLGQSDRVITSICNVCATNRYPAVDKIALVAVEKEQEESIAILKKGGFFVDEKNRVVILQVQYQQHHFNADNVRQERALSPEQQYVIHPITGEKLAGLNIIKDTTNFFLRLNDITRGEYTGRIVYKRNEIVEGTETDEKRLKCLFYWLSKHQRRIVSYSDEFFANVAKVLDSYLLAPEKSDIFESMRELHQDVLTKYSYIKQARKVRLLEDIQNRIYKGERITYLRMLEEACEVLRPLKFEVASYFDQLVLSIISCSERILNDRYLIRNYIAPQDDGLSVYGKNVKHTYGKLVSLLDDFTAIRKVRRES